MATFNYRSTNLSSHDVVMDEGIKQKTFGEKANTRKALRPLNQGQAQQGLKAANLGKKTQKPNLLQPRVKQHQVHTRTLRSSRVAKEAKQSSALDIFFPAEEHVAEEPHDLEMEAVEEPLVKAAPVIINIDEGDEECPQMCTGYVEEIMDYLHVLEKRYVVRPDYMDEQPDVHHRMRAILIDWLVEVHMKFKLLQETLYLTVTIIDRYLEATPVSRSKLQLVGCTAMLVASKYEEIYAPEVRDFIYISDNAYTPEEVLEMERHMLLTLNFSFSNPLPLHFLRRNSKAAGADSPTHNTAKFIMELSLVDYAMIKFTPSEIAAAALHVSMDINEFGEWDDTLAHYSKFTEQRVLPVVSSIKEMMFKARKHPKLQAVRNKYKSSRVGEVTQRADVWLAKKMAEQEK